MENPKNDMSVVVDTDFSLEVVPETARKGFRSMFFVMLGFTFFSASMSVGAKLGNGLDLTGFIWACLIGGTILSIYCGILAYIGSETGMSMDLLCRRAFGSKGSYVSSFVLGFTQIGWFGVGVAMFSIPTAELVGINEWILTIAAGIVMTATAATGMKDRVTASHTTAMHSYNNAYVSRLMRILKMSGINFVANPCVNTHLGGRADTYPKRRSLTRVKELTAEGCNVSFGNDDVFDPWNPLGNAGMRDVVFMGLYAGHMLGYEEIMNSWRFVTTNAARTLHLGGSIRHQGRE